MLKQCLATLFLLSLPLCAHAGDAPGLPPLTSPAKAVIAPSLATLFVQADIPVEMIDGAPCIRVLLPSNAQDFQIQLDNSQILRTSQRAVIGMPEGELSRERARIESEIAALEGKIAAISAKISYAAEDISRGIDIQALHIELSAAQQRVKTLKNTLKSYPEKLEQRTLFTAAVTSDAGSKVSAAYSYKVPDCTWHPEYKIDCFPRPDGKGTIKVRLEAVVEQTSCFDWKNTEIQLVTTGAGAVRQPSLRSWNIGHEAEEKRSMARYAMEDSAPMMMAAGNAAPARSKTPAKPAVADISGTFASWTPVMRGLPQGDSRILLNSADGEEDIVWKVRPLNRDARVFLCAEHELEKNIVWPEGRARLSLDGAAIGTDDFTPRKGKVSLSFGTDPRVQLAAKTEPRKSGTQGFIGKDKIWEWAWQYTIRNDRETPVNVAVERPLPKSVNKEVKVEYTTVPQAKAEDARLVWELNIPPHQSAVIEHGVKVTAPEKLPIITPVAP
ncbi:MAG: DUF4139 domain-containing protein [Mailhella sp.]|nr:DUF4139 domain-containing protein [Mailhella sp.]